jgi:hypothetical protein
MEKLFSKIMKKNLEPDEKLKILSVLQNFVDENPIQSIRSPFYSFWSIASQKKFMAPVSIAIVFALVTGTTFAAKNSLPNDMLYPIKMLDEGVQSLIAVDTKTKAQVEAAHAISRLEEVEQIVNLSKQIDQKTRKEILNNFGAQAQSVAKNVDELEKSGKTKDASIIWSDFKKSVAEHEKTITELSDSTSTKAETQKELSNVIHDIHSHFEKTSNRSNWQDNQNNAATSSEQIQGEVKGAETSNQMEIKQNIEKNDFYKSERKGKGN